jgi:hypothetical protein
MLRVAILPIPIIALTFSAEAQRTVAERFAAPNGCERVACAPGSFGAYLRALPLKPPASAVLHYDGTPKHRQDVHAAVLDISVGRKDLQQCADAVIRLRAEYLWATGRSDEIAFRFTNGFLAEWKRWKRGERIRVDGKRCTWAPSAQPDDSHEQLLRYLDIVFTYAGTLSLSRELVAADGQPRPGDVLIQGGSPGHAMLVVDAACGSDNRWYVLLAQGYMPAQDIHVVRNTGQARQGAWFAWGEGDQLRTPEWTFAWGDLRRWP